MKRPIAKTFARTPIGGRWYSRAPTDSTAPTAPTLADPVTGNTTLSLLWTHGVDGESGIRESWVEIRLHGTSDWSRTVVSYPTKAHTFSALPPVSSFEARVGSVDSAGNVTYSSIKTASTTGTNADTEPGSIEIRTAALTTVEGATFSIELTRVGAGSLATAAEADWAFTASEGVPSPANGTVLWGVGENSAQVTVHVAGAVSQDRTLTFRIVAVRALSGSIQPALGTNQITVTIRDATVSAGIKWHPGHYVLQTSASSYTVAMIDEIGAIANVKGWLQYVNWRTLEPTRGAYDFTFTDALIARCKAVGKRTCIALLDRAFSTGNPLPAYLATEPNGNGGWYQRANGFYVAKIYHAAIMSRLIALIEALGARYDNEPYFEGVVCLSESVLKEVTTRTTDYTEAAYLTQFLRLIERAPLGFPHTNVWIGMNFGFQQTRFQTILDAMVVHRCGTCAPDIVTSNPDRSTNADRALRGLRYVDGEWVSGGTDYRPLLAVSHESEGPAMGGKEAGFTMAQLRDFSYNTHHDRHVFWLRKTHTASPNPPADLYWDNTQPYATNPRGDSPDVKTWLTSQAGSNPTRTSPPASYLLVNTN